MKLLLLILVFAIVGCAPSDPADMGDRMVASNQSIAFAIYGDMSLAGPSYTEVDDDCDSKFLYLELGSINDGEIVCTTGDAKFSENVLTVMGVDCAAEGHKLSDFEFYFKRNSDGTHEYRNSGDGWITIKNCPQLN